MSEDHPRSPKGGKGKGNQQNRKGGAGGKYPKKEEGGGKGGEKGTARARENGNERKGGQLEEGEFHFGFILEESIS